MTAVYVEMTVVWHMAMFTVVESSVVSGEFSAAIFRVE
jgi:hypothetical protein